MNPSTAYAPERWMESATCRQVDPELFFADTTSPTQIRMAKAVCATCPVQAECLDYALRDHIRHGIFGGLCDDEREATRRRKART